MGEKQRVWVIGAGITGLTAAHELAERGFEVIVVEGERDVMSPHAPALGGMARTQWALVPPPTPGSMGETLKPIPLPAIEFEPYVNGIAKDGLKTLKSLAEAKHLHVFPINVLSDFNRDEDYDQSMRDATLVAEELKKYCQQLGSSPDIHALPNALAESDMISRSVSIQLVADVVPGEHGFRFFHGFYRHVFDTMRRIPIAEEGEVSVANATRTVYENLVPSDGFRLDFRTENGMARSVEFPRRKFIGLREIHDTLQGFLEVAGHTSEDIAHISLKILKYMTSCSKRRQLEYENMSWWDFVDGPSFREPARGHYERAPQVLVGLTAKKCDARTQGNVVTQMLLDQLLQGGRADATLNGPTTSAWFVPWKKYLESQDVKFVNATLEGFDVDENLKFVLPKFDGHLEKNPAAGDYFVLAISLHELAGVSSLEPRAGLAHALRDAVRRIGATEIADIEALCKFCDSIGDWNSPIPEVAEDSALRHMNGIQFYFPADVPQKAGRALFLESEWRLSSLSQVAFWRRQRNEHDGYRGILSIDIGAWHSTGGKFQRTAWGSTKREIAEATWEQIQATIEGRERGYHGKPVWYHVDDAIICTEDPADAKRNIVTRNDAPYLVSKPGDWKCRPGRLDAHRGYQVQANHWVLAGTYMQTFTRLTSMESANESGRHAVNGILENADPGVGQWPRCRIWNPEDRELPDLKWLKELDEKLYEYPAADNAQRLPHFMDILEIEGIHDFFGVADGEESPTTVLRGMITKMLQHRRDR